METSKRLVLRFERGQFTFRHFDHEATDEQLYALGRGLNSFQADEAVMIIKTTVVNF